MAGYSVTFSVVDNATKQIDGINRRIAAMRAPMERMSKQVQRFVDVSGLGNVAKGFEWIGRAASNVLRTMIEIIPVLGTLTGAASIAGMNKLVSSYADWSKQLSMNADSLGMTTQQMQQFEDAARLAGGKAEDMDASLQGLYQTQSNFIRGQASAESIQWMNRLGISMLDANGKARSMADLMPEVERKIAAIENPADRAAAATALLGARGADLVEAFRTSHKSLDQHLDDARKYIGLTNDQIAALESFKEAQARVGVSFDHLGQQISATLAAHFTPLINHLAEFVDKHTPQILAAVDSLSSKFANWLANIKWDDVQAGLNKVCSAIGWLINNLDTVGKAAEAIAAIFAAKWAVGVVASIGQVVTALAPLSAALLPIAAAIGVITAYELNKKGQKEIEDKAKGMGFEQQPGGLLGEPTFVNPKTGEKLSYPEMMQRQGKMPEGYSSEGYSPEQQSIGKGLRNFWNRIWKGPAEIQQQSAPGPALGPMNLPQETVQRGAAIRDRLAKDLDITPAQASGIVGNLQAESGLKAVQEKNPIAGRGGFGWAQWTGPRRVEFEAYAKAHGLDPTSDEANYGFLKQELQSPQYKGMMDRLRQQKDEGSSAALVERGYEGPAVSNADVRARYATQIAAAPAPAAPPVQVAQATAPPAAVPPPPAAVNGAVDVNITGKNLPPNTSVTAKGSGAVNVPPPRVEQQEMASI